MRALAIALLAAAACGGRLADQTGLTSAGVDAAMTSSSSREASTTEGSPGPASSGASPFADAAAAPFDASGLTTCASCLALACQDLLIQCQQSAACAALYACTLETPGSVASCGCSAPAEVLAPFAALERCLDGVACGSGACASLCGSAASCDDQGLGCAGPPTSSAASCDACVASSCAPFVAACDNGSDCDAYVACLTTCEAPECETDCGAAHPTGQSAAQGLDVCLGGACQAACGF